MVDQRYIPEEETFGIENLYIINENNDEIEKKFNNLQLESDDQTSEEESDDEANEDDESQQEDSDDEENSENDFIERGPLKRNNNINNKFHPYNEMTKQTPETNDQIYFNIVKSLTDEQLLQIADQEEFKKFVHELEYTVSVVKPRRESEDSSYFSENSPYSYGDPNTPQEIQQTAQETLRKLLNKDVAIKDWVRLNLLKVGEVYHIDENGNSRLHRLLLDKKENPYIKEQFYNLVQFMKKNKIEFTRIINMQPTLRSIIEQNYPTFLDFFLEVQLSLRE